MPQHAIHVPSLRRKHGVAWFIEKMEPMHVARGVSDHRCLIGRSPAFQRLFEMIARVAPSDASVLLQRLGISERTLCRRLRDLGLLEGRGEAEEGARGADIRQTGARFTLLTAGLAVNCCNGQGLAVKSVFL